MIVNGYMKNSSQQPARTDPLDPPPADGAISPVPRLRSLPSVDALVKHAQAQLHLFPEGTSQQTVTRAVRETLADARERVRAGRSLPSTDDLAASVLERLRRSSQSHLRPVINATGIVVNTNLGRAPLGQRAIEAMELVARAYSNLEYDLAAGERGSRHEHVAALLRALTGAENALVVNNNAAAVLVVLAALTAGKEVLISRGELVEIGGGFRIPDVLRQSGARLVEVGTTNKTRLADFAAAITTESGALLSVHPSNFRVLGFTETPTLAALAELAHQRGLPLLHDLGSGSLLPTESFGLEHEPTPQESIAAGVDIVCFSGDKLLGGPQVGIICGRAELLSRIAVHPLMRAIRIDKLTLAALEGTLRDYIDNAAHQRVPVIRMLATPYAAISQRAEQWAARLRAESIPAAVIDGESAVGGGSLPGETLPTALCAISNQYAALLAPDAASTLPEVGLVAARLRESHPPVVARVLRGQLLLDPRTVLPEQDDELLQAVQSAIIDQPQAP